MRRSDTRTSSRQNRPPVVSRELIGRIGHGVGENYVAGSARANIRLDNQGPGRRKPRYVRESPKTSDLCLYLSAAHC